MMSGLTVGFLAIDKLDMKVKQEIGTDQQKEASEKIVPILEKHHRLLTTLLLMNAIAMESLPIFLDRIVPSFYAVIISVFAITIVGEIIPQAICTGPKQIVIAYAISPFVKFLMFISFPINWTIGKVLDYVLGEEHDSPVFPNEQLKELVAKHSNEELKEFGEFQKASFGLSNLQVGLITGAIDMNNLPLEKVDALIVERSKITTVSTEDLVDKALMLKICECKFSRVLVHYGSNQNLVIGQIKTI